MILKLTILPGDGIGPEVTDEAERVLEGVATAFGHQLDVTRKNVGGAALTASNDPLPDDTLQCCLASQAVLLGAVGGPAFDHFPGPKRPEAGLLRLRRELGVFANLRPAICFSALEDASPLRREIVHGTDILIVRELLGGRGQGAGVGGCCDAAQGSGCNGGGRGGLGGNKRGEQATPPACGPAGMDWHAAPTAEFGQGPRVPG